MLTFTLAASIFTIYLKAGIDSPFIESLFITSVRYLIMILLAVYILVPLGQNLTMLIVLIVVLLSLLRKYFVLSCQLLITQQCLLDFWLLFTICNVHCHFARTPSISCLFQNPPSFLYYLFFSTRCHLVKYSDKLLLHLFCIELL